MKREKKNIENLQITKPYSSLWNNIAVVQIIKNGMLVYM